MNALRDIVFALLIFTLFFWVPGSTALAEEKKELTNLDQSEELTKIYLEAFKKSGVPTPKAVDAAFEKAKSTGTIEAWVEASTIANLYANIINALRDHYSSVYYSSGSSGRDRVFSYLSKGTDYEKVRNRYLEMRNQAFIELGKLYLAKGDKGKALSYIITAVKLSATEPNTIGENLIKQIIEFSE